MRPDLEHYLAAHTGMAKEAQSRPPDVELLRSLPFRLVYDEEEGSWGIRLPLPEPAIAPAKLMKRLNEIAQNEPSFLAFLYSLPMKRLFLHLGIEEDQRQIASVASKVHEMANQGLGRFLAETEGIRKVTPRLFEVWKLMSGGLTNEEISTEVGTSVSTIKNQNTDLFDRIGVRDRSQAILLGLALEIFDIREVFPHHLPPRP